MGRNLPKTAQILEAVGNGSKGDIKDRTNGAGPGSNVQGGGAVGTIICQIELGCDQGDAQGPDGFSPSVGMTDHGNYGETWCRRIVGLTIGRGDNGIREDTSHKV